MEQKRLIKTRKRRFAAFLMGIVMALTCLQPFTAFAEDEPVAPDVPVSDGCSYNPGVCGNSGYWIHTYDTTDWEVYKAATCTETGIDRWYCDCGEEYEERVSKALGHDYDPKTGICRRCGAADPNGLIVTFDPDNGSDVSKVSVLTGKTVEKPEDPKKEHSVFKFWYVYTEGSTDEPKEFDFTTPITQSITLKAYWEVTEYCVTFDPDYGKPVTKVYVKKGETVSKPADPKKNHNSFLYWYDVSATGEPTEFDFSTPITQDITLKARWAVAEYVVSFDPDNGDEIITFTLPAGEKLGSKSNSIIQIYDKSQPKKEGYEFQYWYETTDNVTDPPREGTWAIKHLLPNSILKQNYHFKAYYKTGKCTVAFMSDYGVSIPAATVEYGKTVSRPEDPVKDGLYFLGWYTDDGKEYDFSQPVTGNLILNAKWTNECYSVTYYMHNNVLATEYVAKGRHPKGLDDRKYTDLDLYDYVAYYEKCDGTDEPVDLNDITDKTTLYCALRTNSDNKVSVKKKERGNTETLYFKNLAEVFENFSVWNGFDLEIDVFDNYTVPCGVKFGLPLLDRDSDLTINGHGNSLIFDEDSISRDLSTLAELRIYDYAFTGLNKGFDLWLGSQCTEGKTALKLSDVVFRGENITIGSGTSLSIDNVSMPSGKVMNVKAVGNLTIYKIALTKDACLVPKFSGKKTAVCNCYITSVGTVRLGQSADNGQNFILKLDGTFSVDKNCKVIASYLNLEKNARLILNSASYLNVTDKLIFGNNCYITMNNGAKTIDLKNSALTITGKVNLDIKGYNLANTVVIRMKSKNIKILNIVKNNFKLVGSNSQRSLSGDITKGTITYQVNALLVRINDGKYIEFKDLDALIKHLKNYGISSAKIQIDLYEHQTDKIFQIDPKYCEELIINGNEKTIYLKKEAMLSCPTTLRYVYVKCQDGVENSVLKRMDRPLNLDHANFDDNVSVE